MVENNCLKYLVLADKYNEEHLKEFALNVLVKEFSSLSKTEKWKKMKKTHPDLMIEVMENVINEKKM